MTVLIDNWSCVSFYWLGLQRDPFDNEFLPLELGNCLHGKVQGHPKIEDGHRAHTSIIKEISRDPVTFQDQVITETGTVYRLGKINPEFEKWVRQAKCLN